MSLSPSSPHAGQPFQPTLFVEGVRLSPGQERVLVALDYLDAIPALPQAGRTTAEIAVQAAMTAHVARARLADLREAGLVESGPCPHFQRAPLADAEIRHAHYLTGTGYRRSRWAVIGRPDKATLTGPDERLLAYLYRLVAVPTDRLARVPKVLAELGDAFRAKTGMTLDDEVLLHHMLSSRKQGHWPRLGRSMRNAFDQARLPEAQLQVLLNLYRQQETPADGLMTHAQGCRGLARAFATATGERQPVRVLVDALLSARKAGQLPRLGR